MKLYLSGLIFGFCMMFSVSVFAGGSSQGLVTFLRVIAGDVAMFAAGSHSGKPACSTVGDEWAFTLTTPSGKAMYTLLLSAQAQGKQVAVNGLVSPACKA